MEFRHLSDRGSKARSWRWWDTLVRNGNGLEDSSANKTAGWAEVIVSEGRGADLTRHVGRLGDCAVDELAWQRSAWLEGLCRSSNNHGIDDWTVEFWTLYGVMNRHGLDVASRAGLGEDAVGKVSFEGLGPI